MKLTDKEILDFVKENITIAKHITGHIEIKEVLCSIIGDVVGNVRGNVCGGVYGNVIGDVYGNVYGNVFKDVSGDVYGNVFKDVGGDVGGGVRCSANGDEEMLTFTSDDSHEVIRQVVTWGTYGKNGDETMVHVKIADMSTQHLQACLDTQKSMSQSMRKVMQDELEYRNES